MGSLLCWESLETCFWLTYASALSLTGQKMRVCGWHCGKPGLTKRCHGGINTVPVSWELLSGHFNWPYLREERIFTSKLVFWRFDYHKGTDILIMTWRLYFLM